ncbi:thermonuclease family protein [Falsiroseomonas sp. HW251]|uniref:thermonuclease family protein n=1 Tax=Falsiroseomonas sp. HW251 TaxID=3390998 RepID=UPI003D314A39
MRPLVLLVIVAGAAWLLARPDALSPAREPSLSGFARAVDGDTLAIGARRIRLAGIDAPESAQICERDGSAWPCGALAAQALAGMVQGRVVTCSQSGEDRYGRALARCEAAGEDLGAAMVRLGWAVAYARYSWRYIPQEWQARWRGVGLWAGRFETPEDWRRAHSR